MDTEIQQKAHEYIRAYLLRYSGNLYARFPLVVSRIVGKQGTDSITPLSTH